MSIQITDSEMRMKLKDYIKSLQNAIKDNPTLADLEVWNFTDDEGNSIRPCDGGVLEAYVSKEGNLETDDYVTEDYLKEYLDDYEISVEDFQETHKRIILL